MNIKCMHVLKKIRKKVKNFHTKKDPRIVIMWNASMNDGRDERLNHLVHPVLHTFRSLQPFHISNYTSSNQTITK